MVHDRFKFPRFFWEIRRSSIGTPIALHAGMNRNSLLLVAPLLLIIPACRTMESSAAIGRIVSSSPLPTSELDGWFQITGARGKNNVTAGAGFLHKTDLVRLDGQDAVYCDGIRLTDGYATLSRRTPGQTYQFEFRRATESITVSVAAIDEIQVLSPSASAELSRHSPTTVTWTAKQGNTVDAQLFANCAITDAKSDDVGTVTLPAFLPVGDDGSPQVDGGPQVAANAPCDGSVWLRRYHCEVPKTTLASTRAQAEEDDSITVRVVQ